MTLETIKLLCSTEWKITKDKNGDNVSQLEITDVVLVHFNYVSNQYQHNSIVLCTFVWDNSLDQLLNISPTNHMYTERFPLEFLRTEVWFTGQNSMQIKTEDRVNLILVVNNKVI